jgi:hypothetical protein
MLKALVSTVGRLAKALLYRNAVRFAVDKYYKKMERLARKCLKDND